MYNIQYKYDGKTRIYCAANMDLNTAKDQFSKFMARYIGPDGKGRPYPNGKGSFPITDPRIVRVM
jgi:hypothetical protein